MTEQMSLADAEDPKRPTRFLKGRVVIGRTIHLAPYNSFKVEVMEEYNTSQHSFEEIFDNLTGRLRAKLIERRLIKE